MPLTELWLSEVSTKRLPWSNGYASATRWHAPVALGVKMTAYSSGEAFKKASTARRAEAISSVEAIELGLPEWGLPCQAPLSRRACPSNWRQRGQPGAGVVEVDPVPIRVLTCANLVEAVGLGVLRVLLEQVVRDALGVHDWSMNAPVNLPGGECYLNHPH